MGFFDKLLGREVVAHAGWESSSDEKRAATTRAVLEKAAAFAGVTDGVVYAEKHDGDLDLRGSIRGLPFRVKMDDRGTVRDLELKYAKAKFEYIDLEFDPDLPIHDMSSPPWSADEQKIFFAPQIHVEGSSAEKEAAAFRRLPASLQERVLAGMRKLNILYFRSRREEHEVTLHGDATDKVDPARWLADILTLSADIAIARGVTPPGEPPPAVTEDDDDEVVSPAPKTMAVARKVAAQIAGASIVARDDDDRIDVRWTEHGLPVRIVLDYGSEDVDVEVAVPNVSGAFDLWHNADVDPSVVGPTDDPWDQRERQEILGPGVYLCGSPVGLRRQVALVRSIGGPLFDELAAAMAEHAIDEIELADGLLASTIGALDEVKGATALQLAKLLARVAAALPSS